MSHTSNKVNWCKKMRKIIIILDGIADIPPKTPKGLYNFTV